MFEFRGIEFAYADRAVLRGVTALAPTGQVTGLLGVNGSGKSTLLKLIAGVNSMQGGSLLLNGEAITAYGRLERARRISYLSQRTQPAWDIPATDLVALGALPYPEWKRAQRTHAIEHAMRETDCLHLAERDITALSAGELQRVLLARLLVGDAQLVLADEPTNGLDPRHQLDTMACFQRLAQQGKTVVVVLHDLHLAEQFCDQIVMLHEGRVHANGPTAAVFTADNLRHVFSI